VPFIAGINDFVGEALSGAAAANAQAATQAPAPGFVGGAGILRIEPDQVDAAIGVFEAALDKLKHKVMQAQEGIRADPMAHDRVSQPAAYAFNDAASGGSGAAIEAWLGAVREFESIIEQLRAARHANVMTDQTVAQPFSHAAS